MCDNETPDHKESGTDRECIDAIPRRASVVGIDTDGRAHLSSIYGELEIWVLNEAGTAQITAAFQDTFWVNAAEVLGEDEAARFRAIVDAANES